MSATPVFAESPAGLPPEQGQLVRVRNRLWLVQDALPHEADDGQVATRLELECLDDDRLGQLLSVIWEREVNTEVFHADRFPLPSGKWDSPTTLNAFLTAIRWSATSVLSTGGLLSPFRGAIELRPFQLEPAARVNICRHDWLPGHRLTHRDGCTARRKPRHPHQDPRLAKE